MPAGPARLEGPDIAAPADLRASGRVDGALVVGRGALLHAEALGLDGGPTILDPDPADEPSLLARMRQKGAELTGRHHDAGLLLLADLRHFHKEAAGTSLDWELLAQTAQALQDTTLLEVAQRCHPQTLRQLRWANAKLKETSPQLMAQ